MTVNINELVKEQGFCVVFSGEKTLRLDNDVTKGKDGRRISLF